MKRGVPEVERELESRVDGLGFDLVEALWAVLEGRSVVPIEVIRALTASRSAAEDEQVSLTPEQMTWLRQLASGATIRQLAEQANYSERAMFRHLRELYTVLGVHNRTGAMMYARERGWA